VEVEEKATYTPTEVEGEPTSTPTPDDPPANGDILAMLDELRASVLELPMYSADRKYFLAKVDYSHDLAECGQLCATKSQLTHVVTRVYELTKAKRLSYEAATILLDQAGDIIQHLREKDVCAHNDWSWH
jgi:hypothetical protein